MTFLSFQKRKVFTLESRGSPAGKCSKEIQWLLKRSVSDLPINVKSLVACSWFQNSKENGSKKKNNVKTARGLVRFFRSSTLTESLAQAKSLVSQGEEIQILLELVL